MRDEWNENVVKCSDCGIEWKKIGKACPVCYASPEKIIPTHSMKKCIICGELIDADLYYCPHCGEWNSCSGLTLKDIFKAESGGPIIESSP